MRRCVVWLGACSLALWVHAPLGVRAQQQEPLPPFEETSVVVVNASAGIPENGALLIDSLSYDVDLSLEVLDVSTGVKLEGTITKIDDSRYWVWSPVDRWVAGAILEVQVTNAAGDLSIAWQRITIVPAVELAPPSLMTAPSASLISVIAQKTCCRVLSAGLVQSSNCFPIRNEASVVLDPGIATGASTLVAGQYLFRFDTGGDRRSVFTTGSFANLVLPAFREEQNDYCFAVTAIELPTLNEHTYDDLDVCAEHGSLGDVGASAEEPTDAALDRAVCAAPPVGFEERWCELNEACAEDDDEGEGVDDCFLYEHVCEGAELPAPNKQDPPVLDPPGSTRDGGTEDDDESGENAQAASDRDGGGCSVAIAERTRGLWALAWLAGVAAGLLVWRRRHFEPRCARTGARARSGPRT